VASFLHFSQFDYSLLDSPEIGSLVTAGEEENNPTIGTGLKHTFR
jgi:hypothetical protein